MTSTTAQKAWDGVMLVFLMLPDFLWRMQYQDRFLAGRWLEEEGVEVVAKKFEFTGRTMMLGAIQSFSGSQKTEWVDGIVTPHPRRDAWLERLRQPGDASECMSTLHGEKTK